VVYAIAAYTITLGALALYAVMLQHRRRVFAASPDALHGGSDGRSVATGDPPGFNLGAALLAPFWMWRHGMPIPGTILLGTWIAVVPLYANARYPNAEWIALVFVGAVPLAAGAALGFVGNRIARGHRGAESVAAFSASQLPWATAGVVLFSIVLPWAWYFAFAAG
jgi:prolipoprotein diacylglyceryltransferase